MSTGVSKPDKQTGVGVGCTALHCTVDRSELCRAPPSQELDDNGTYPTSSTSTSTSRYVRGSQVGLVTPG